MVSQWFKRSRAITFTALILALLLAVACGSAAAPANPVVVEKVVVATPPHAGPGCGGRNSEPRQADYDDGGIRQRAV